MNTKKIIKIAVGVSLLFALLFILTLLAANYMLIR